MNCFEATSRPNDDAGRFARLAVALRAGALGIGVAGQCVIASAADIPAAGTASVEAAAAPGNAPSPPERREESTGISLLPRSFSLTGPEARQRLLLMRKGSGGYLGPVEEGALLGSSEPGIVRVEAGVAAPVANGDAEIMAVVDGRAVAAHVTVAGMGQPFVWSFRNHVESVLSKSGCNSGACHGAFAGKHGFKLSLRGFDAEADYSAITRQAGARRVTLAEPARSLFLTKPTGAAPHKGGVRFEPNSPEFRVISRWLAAGAPAPQDSDPRITRLEVLPDHSRLSPGAAQPLVVVARFSDGHMEDVTRWAKYSSTNESAVTVDAQGLVAVVGGGEAAVSAWYQSLNAIASFSVPYPGAARPERFAAAPRKNFIDTLVLAKLESLNLPPAAPANDGEFIRRAFIDTVGMLPSVEETRAFLADSAPDKRDRLIEQLLGRTEFVDYWSYRWCDLLLASGQRLRPAALEAYYQWIRDRVARNLPWDKFAFELLTASGSTVENGATNFFALHQDPTEISESVAASMLGMTINCAKCHNHPLEKWTNDQYYAMANLFSRVQAKGWGGDVRSGDGKRTVFAATTGELIQPSKGKPQPPCPLDGQPLAFDDPRDRRVPMARWLTAPENPYFTRAITNRIWANFFGVGLVEKVDDLRLTNPASNEQLLAATAQFLVDNHYDLKALMRAILQSGAYQQSSQAAPESRSDERFYSHYYPRRLKAETLIDALSQVTGVPTQFKVRYGDSDLKDAPLGKRAMELADVDANSYFFKSFGRPAREITCECERSSQPTMVQALHISNGDAINHKLAAKGNRIDKQLEANLGDSERIDDLYLAALSRSPTDDERSQLLTMLGQGLKEEKRARMEDLYWAVLSSKEFLFNH